MLSFPFVSSFASCDNLFHALCFLVCVHMGKAWCLLLYQEIYIVWRKDCNIIQNQFSSSEITVVVCLFMTHKALVLLIVGLPTTLFFINITPLLARDYCVGYEENTQSLRIFYFTTQSYENLNVATCSCRSRWCSR